jgi:hypothetical protein
MHNTYFARTKFHTLSRRRQLALVMALLIGALEAGLLARLLARLLAARPDNPVVSALFTATAPLQGLFAVLDRGQPQFGAVLELSTLLLAICMPVLGYVVWVLLTRPQPEDATSVADTTSKEG